MNSRIKQRLHRRSLLYWILLYGAAALILLIAVFPFLWMVGTSIKPASETFIREFRLLPSSFDAATLRHYQVVLGRTMIPRYFVNSVKVSILTTGVSIVLASLGAYGFARFRFPGRNPLMVLILAVQMMPIVVVIIPLFLFFRQVGLLNSHSGLVISYATFTLPLCVWMLKGFFDSIPKEIEEAAMVDGCSRFAAYYRIILPLALPGIASSSIFAFIGAWNEFMLAMTFINVEAMKTMPVGLQSFFGQFTVEWNQLMAASVLFTLPSLVFFFFTQKYIVRGLAGGAVKG